MVRGLRRPLRCRRAASDLGAARRNHATYAATCRVAASADGATFVWGGCAPGWDHDDDAPAVGFLGLGELDDIEAAGDTGLAIVTRPRRVDLWKETAVAEVCAGSTHSVAVDRRGGAWCWGVEYTGHPAGTHGHPDAVEVRRSGPDDGGDDVVRADGGGAPCSRPTPLALGVRIVGASCGAFHTLLLAEAASSSPSAAARRGSSATATGATARRQRWWRRSTS